MKKLSVFTLAAVMGLALMPAAASAAPDHGQHRFRRARGPLTPTTTAVDITGAALRLVLALGGASTPERAWPRSNGSGRVRSTTSRSIRSRLAVTCRSGRSCRTVALTASTCRARDRLADRDFLNLSGSGILHITGFDDTPGTWAFTASHAVGGALFTFDSNTGVTPGEGEGAAPEPASLLLLGLGLTGVASRLARKRAQ